LPLSSCWPRGKANYRRVWILALFYNRSRTQMLKLPPASARFMQRTADRLPRLAANNLGLRR
jgi:hypothetical protein